MKRQSYSSRLTFLPITKTFTKSLLSVVMLFLIWSNSFAQINITTDLTINGGDVATAGTATYDFINTNDGVSLNADGVTIEVTQNIIVDGGATLTIINGTKFKFGAKKYINVLDAELKAVGQVDPFNETTPDLTESRLSFSAIDPSTGWGGIQFGMYMYFYGNDSDDIALANIFYSSKNSIIDYSDISQTKKSLNASIRGGGAIAIRQYDSVKVDHCNIFENENQYGGGLYVKQAKLILSNCIIYSNNITYGAAAVYARDDSDNPYQSNITLTNNEIKNNYTTSKLGALYFRDIKGKLIIRNNLFENNCVNIYTSGSSTGGAITYISSSIDESFIFEINKNIFRNNNATFGGAIYLKGIGKQNTTITNNLIHNNSARVGAGIYTSTCAGGIQFLHNTICYNKTTYKSGEGILRIEGITYVSNNIIYGNEAPENKFISAPNYSVFEYNNIDDNYYSTVNANTIINQNISSDPLFVSIPSQAGYISGKTDWSDVDFSLKDGSPCIDAGTSSSSISGITIPTEDIKGIARPQGNTVDMGAYEYSTPCTTDITPDFTITSNIASCATTDGSLDVILNGTINNPYTISWSGDATGIVSNIDLSTPYSISGLGKGTYDITITDANGCEAIFTENIVKENIELEFVSLDPCSVVEFKILCADPSETYDMVKETFYYGNPCLDNLVITSESDMAICPGGTNSPIYYEYSAENRDLDVNSNFKASGNALDPVTEKRPFKPGVYKFEITISGDAERTDFYTFETQGCNPCPSTIVTGISVNANANCDDQNYAGSFVAEFATDVDPLEYTPTWTITSTTNGDVFTDPTGLKVDEYTVEFDIVNSTDPSCSQHIEGTYNITRACPIALNSNLVVNACDNSGNGTVTFTPENIGGRYSYELFDGQNIIVGNTQTVFSETGDQIINLNGADDYVLRIFDTQDPAFDFSLTFTAEACCQMTSTVTNTVESTCSGNNGEVTVTLTNSGVGPYSVEWSGTTTGSQANILLSEFPLPIIGFEAGNYTFKVIDNGITSIECSNESTVTVTEEVIAEVDFARDINGNSIVVADACEKTITFETNGNPTPYQIFKDGVNTFGGMPTAQSSPVIRDLQGKGNYTIRLFNQCGSLTVTHDVEVTNEDILACNGGCAYELVAEDNVTCGSEEVTNLKLKVFNDVELNTGIQGLDFRIDLPNGVDYNEVATLGTIVTTNGAAKYSINQVNRALYVSIAYNSNGELQTIPSDYANDYIIDIELLMDGSSPENDPSLVNGFVYSIYDNDLDPNSGIQEAYALTESKACASSSTSEIVGNNSFTSTITTWNNKVEYTEFDLRTNSVDNTWNPNAEASHTIADASNISQVHFTKANFSQAELIEYVNGFDCLEMFNITTFNASSDNLALKLIAADVNMNDKVRSNDITLTQMRILGLESEYPQTWNYLSAGNNTNAGDATMFNNGYSIDWRFIETDVADNNSEYLNASKDYITNNVDGTTWRDNVPTVENFFNLVKTPNNCKTVQDMSFYGVLLGDVTGNYLNPTEKSIEKDDLIFDFQNASLLENGNYVIPVNFHADEVVQSIDFILDYNEINMNIVDVYLVEGGNKMDMNMMFYDEGTELRLTSFSMNGGQQKSENVYYIEVSLNGVELSEKDFIETKTYINGKKANTVLKSLENTLSVTEKVAFTTGINIYPNPTNNLFTVELSDNSPAQIKVYNVVGKIVDQQEGGKNKYNFDLNDFEKGIYLVRVNQNNEIKVLKVIKN